MFVIRIRTCAEQDKSQRNIKTAWKRTQCFHLMCETQQFLSEMGSIACSELPWGRLPVVAWIQRSSRTQSNSLPGHKSPWKQHAVLRLTSLAIPSVSLLKIKSPGWTCHHLSSDQTRTRHLQPCRYPKERRGGTGNANYKPNLKGRGCWCRR